MFKSMLHRLAEHPVVYDLIQKLAGEAKSNAVIASQTKKIDPKSLVVDFGGGTCDFAFMYRGMVRNSWGDMELGGRLFDDLFFQWFIKLFLKLK